MEELVPFGSPLYIGLLLVLILARGSDFLSTWIATPNLHLEANPIAKRLGWKWGAGVNLALCLGFALWPLPAVIIATTSLLVAARNFQSAWLMRSLGEGEYRDWMTMQIMRGNLGLYLLCLIAQSGVFVLIGIALVWFSRMLLIPFGIGLGMITYALVVFFFTSLSLWRLRRSSG